MGKTGGGQVGGAGSGRQGEGRGQEVERELEKLEDGG